MVDVRSSVVFSLMLLCCAACNKPSSFIFTDVTTESGINFRYTFGDSTYENILESSGSGVTVLDFDNDGDMDIYFLNGTYLHGISDSTGKNFANTPDELYRNNGDGTFTNATSLARVGDMHWSMAAVPNDYDEDGDMDIYQLNYGPNVFFQNQGDGTFRDITEETGLQGPDSLNAFPKWSVSGIFMDYDRDGLQDVMVGNFLAFDPAHKSPGHPEMMPHPSEYHGQASLMYRQTSPGKFEDVTASRSLLYPESKCMGLSVFDCDGDGDLDIVQANDHQPNFLFRNNGSGVFAETGVASGIAVNDGGVPTGSMHPSLGDVDGDGLIDILVTDLEHGALYRNRGNGLFEDITATSGLSALFTGKGVWAGLLFDYDNDGDLDLFSANGVAEVLTLQHPLLLENDGKGHFTDAGDKAGAYFNEKRSGRGAAVVDYDNDGDLDVIVSHVDMEAAATLLRNESAHQNHWLGLTLHERNGGFVSPGAQIIVKAGGDTYVAIDEPGNAYLSFNDPRIHVGLGNHSSVEHIEVIWPDGTTEVFDQISVDKYNEIREGTGRQSIMNNQ